MKSILLATVGVLAWTAYSSDGGTDPVFDAPAAAQFAEVGATAKSVSFRTVPSRWIVDDWHRLGVKVYVVLCPDALESPELFRRRAGFLTFRSGADGVRWGGKEADRAFFASALAAAEDDRALAARLDALAEKAIADKNSDVRLAGRRERVYVQIAADFSSAPSALIRRELAVRIRGLQKMLGEAPMAVPKDIPDAPAKPFVPPKDAREIEPAPQYQSVKVFPDVELRVHSYGVEFLVLGDRPLKRNEWPGVKRDFTLYIPGTNRTEWLTYRLSCDLTERAGASAGSPAAPRVQFYTLEPRFYGTTGNRFRTQAMHLPAYGRPVIRLSYGYEAPVHCHAGSGEKWTFPFFYPWQQLSEVLPKRNTLWYLREGDEWVRIKWRNPVDGFTGLNFSNVFRDYDQAVGAALGNWGYEDPLFRDACVQPLVDRNRSLADMLRKKIGPLGQAQWSASDKYVREKAAANIRGVFLFPRDLEAARIRYLDDVLAGRPVKVPERKKKAEEKKPRGPSLDDAEGDINLDDAEY